jgi:hypothetical protein
LLIPLPALPDQVLRVGNTSASSQPSYFSAPLNKKDTVKLRDMGFKVIYSVKAIAISG